MAAQFKARKMFITIDDPEEAENFLRGLIVARSNNSSDYFVQLIEGVNLIMEPYRRALIEEGVDAAASKPKKVGVE
jgi:nitrate reductase alpha subunit